MANLRLLNVIVTGLGYFYASSLHKWRVNAELDLPETDELEKNSDDSITDSILTRVSKYGIPKRDVVLNYRDFQVSYDNQKRIPNWVLEHLTKSNLQTIFITKGENSSFKFHGEPRIDKRFQAYKSDYEESQFRPAQLIDKDNHRCSKIGFNDTFNIVTTVPQNFIRESSAWDRLETFGRYLTHKYKNVYILTGPLFRPSKDDKCHVEYQVLSPHRIAVPTHLFKVFICELDNGNFHIGCYVLPNANEPIRPTNMYRVSLSELEEMAGFVLFKDEENQPVLEPLEDMRDFMARRAYYMKLAGLADLL